MVSIVIGGGLGYVTYLDSAIARPTNEQFNKETIVKNKQVIDNQKNKEGYTNIAVFGVDARNSTLGEGNRSDSIIIATINNETKDVKLTSVYRDTLVSIPGHGYDKLTHAYSFGGPQLALSTINQNFDLEITEYVTVNFAIAEDIVDLLGGIDIDIDSSEVKWLNGYVRSLAKQGADTNVKFIDGPGVQTLSGSQAVAYSRIRYTSGGDYKRAKRQRTVLNAALEKAKKSDIKTLDSIIQSVVGDIYTSLTTTDILNLAKDVLAYNIGDSQGFPYHVKNGRVLTVASPANKTFVGIPSMLSEDVRTLHYVLYGIGHPSTEVGISDSTMTEDNGMANRIDGEEAPGIIQGGGSTTDSTKDYEPSEMVKSISNELLTK